MLIRFTTPSFIAGTEYASGAEADLPADVANMALSLGRAVQVVGEPAPTADPAPRRTTARASAAEVA